MWIGRRSDGGIAYGSEIKGEQVAFADRQIINRGQLHEKVVRMLSICNRQSISRFTLLEQQRVTFAGHSCGLKAEHRPGRKLSLTEGPRRHRHEPVGGIELVSAAR